jgi:hypothetical protein
LTISKLKRWSINYYIDTAQATETAARDLARPGGGLGESYSERENRTPVWLLAGNTDTVRQHRHRPATRHRRRAGRSHRHSARRVRRRP